MLQTMDATPDDGAVQVRGLRRSEYEHLIALGAFGDERVELVRGELLTMSPQGAPHAWVTAALHWILVKQLGDEWLVRSHSGLAAWDHSMPEPDLAVVPRGGPAHHPTTAVLVVEVAETSLRFDRGRKATLYAEAGIPAYWVVDLANRCVHVYTAPREDRYQAVATSLAGATLEIAGLPVTVETAALFPDP